MFLEIDDVTVTFEGHRALDSVSLAVDRREVVTVLGPSGSGKSTLLRVVAGLQEPDRGTVGLGRTDLTRTPTHQRGIGLMFQDYALFPHRDVAGNVAFGLRMVGWERPAMDSRVAEVLELVGLPGFGPRKIDDLSGGEQQRVALARALAPSPEVLLLDEPLGALDRALRERLVEELITLFAELELTIVLVTHDRDEAFALGHRVAVMNEGRICQVAPPEELWRQPCEGFVARFLGHTGIMSARIVGHQAETEWGTVDLGARSAGGGGEVELLIRSDRALLVPDGWAGLALPGTVEKVGSRGPMSVLTVATEAGIVEVWHPEPVECGQSVVVGVPDDGVVILSG
ncbi:MAG: ABC transporter ATP-binding protein [Actinomycetia bacterium]|nr:ABC transporter ATP-binding protein [Actinomycetes bacterium]MCP4084778.1 ABC transporter ATP-binding protein [Actinomycetes bacterium]